MIKKGILVLKSLLWSLKRKDNHMKVKELIKILSCLDEDTEVIFDYRTGDFSAELTPWYDDEGEKYVLMLA